MDCLHVFQDSLRKFHLLPDKKNVLLAVSGGIDSVVLCELAMETGLPFALAHCNFGLRGEESERDEAFVRSLAGRYGVDVYVAKFETAAVAAAQKVSVQEAARALRYDWFDELRREHGFAATLLAHHADDKIETLLMNFFRGTGLEGLTGMPEEKKEARCLRPMLHLRRSEIETFAKEHRLQWVEDSSNASSKYTRNFFRNELLPQVRKVFPQAEENLLRNMERLQQVNILYKERVAELKKKVCELKGEEVHIPVLKLMKYRNTSLVYEIIKDFGFGEKFVGEVIKLAEAPSGKYIANEAYRIIRHRAWFIIAPKKTTATTFVIDKKDEAVRFDSYELLLKFVRIEAFSMNTSSLVAQVDVGQIRFPLVLRKWRKGDYFYPLGMRKKKKLARFFIDLKLSQTEKEKVWVLESHRRIVWVVGRRIDDRFKVTDKTGEVLQLSVSSL
ncbi:tRNA lysidine(34) synthetase TilS [Flavisolibacter nicotianae]|uniref:tRNA lysidine(34) synthetase TilS n=1 Tax=Flavisolibacter nicotianae TaxID=2364882 RepID=UPI000EB18004|nr:tRNA lysidine(34) synthetase TilS [Flavisolibacter nicotianae]